MPYRARGEELMKKCEVLILRIYTQNGILNSIMRGVRGRWGCLVSG